MRRAAGPEHVTVLAVEPRFAFDVFRIVSGESIKNPAGLDSLRSNYERLAAPRKIERDWAVIHMGLSTYLDPVIAAQIARRWPQLGSCLARLRLTYGSGFNYAQTGHPRHLTVWGHPADLQAAVVDISDVGS